MTQDETFLPYTINSSLPTQPLPASSLDGSVDTLTGNLRFTSTPIEEVRINASLSYNDRNNQHPRPNMTGSVRIRGRQRRAPTFLTATRTRSGASMDPLP
jgi:hypothetical protein